MKVLSLPMGADTGGVTASIQRAFGNVKPDGWQFRSIISTINYIDYPRDLEWSYPNVNTFWRWADVIHLHHNTIAPELLTRGWKKWRLPRRSYLLHFHGTGFRENRRTHLLKARAWNALPVVATLDLIGDGLEWLPCPVNIEDMQRARKAGQELAAVRGPATKGHEQVVRRPHRQLSKEAQAVKVAHAPTNRDVKGTAFLLDAVKQLQSEGHAIELDLVEGVSWAECLERKAQADIYYDQVRLGYGNNAIECWGMGIPVIAGAHSDTLDEMKRRFGSLPFYRATEATIYDSLKQMILSPDLRDEYAQRGLDHVRAFHSEEKVVEQLKGLYERALR